MAVEKKQNLRVKQPVKELLFEVVCHLVRMVLHGSGEHQDLGYYLDSRSYPWEVTAFVVVVALEPDDPRNNWKFVALLAAVEEEEEAAAWERSCFLVVVVASIAESHCCPHFALLRKFPVYWTCRIYCFVLSKMIFARGVLEMAVRRTFD